MTRTIIRLGDGAEVSLVEELVRPTARVTAPARAC